nr:MAG TPA: SeqA protein N-terminal domain [Caudoviricetes sp.]
MSDKEVGKLEYCCEKTGMSKADVIRRGIELVYKEVSEK